MKLLLVWCSIALTLPFAGCSKGSNSLTGDWKAEMPANAKQYNLPDTILSLKQGDAFELKTALMGGISQTGTFAANGRSLTLTVTQVNGKPHKETMTAEVSEDGKSMTMRDIKFKKL